MLSGATLMGFLWPYFLTGLILTGVPVLIHLFFRIRKRRIVFSTLRFLREAQRKNRRRFQLREWILLLLRIAVILFLTIAFARPYLRGMTLKETIRWRPEDLVIILDDSPSMRTRYDNLSRWNVAERVVNGMIQEAMPSHRIWMVRTSDPGRTVNRQPDERRSLESVFKSAPTYRRGDMLKAVVFARQLLEENSETLETRRRIHIISDMQRTMFRSDDDYRAFLANLDGLRQAGIIIEITGLSMRDPGRILRKEKGVPARSDTMIPAADDLPGNIGITAAKLADRVLSSGEVAVLNVTVTATGSRLPRRIKVSWKRGMESLGAAQLIEIDHSGAYPVTFRWHVDGPRRFASTITLDKHDDFELDDTYYFAVRLKNRLRAPVIEDAETDRRFQSAGYFLRVAMNLAPTVSDHTGAADVNSGYGNDDEFQLKSRYYSERLAVSELNAGVLKSADAVIVAGAQNFTPKQLDALVDYVRHGGGIVWFAGPVQTGRIAPAFAASAARSDGLFGVRLTGVDTPRKTDGVQRSPFTLEAFDASIPPFDLFSSPENGDPKGLAVTRLVTLADADAVSGGKVAGDRVLARLSDGRPLVIQRTLGKGRVILWLTAARPGWCDIYKSKLFVPIMHHSMDALTGAADIVDTRQAITGQAFPLNALLDTLKADTIRSVSSGKRIRLEDAVSERLRLSPGSYQLMNTSGGVDQVEDIVAVNIDPAESDMTPIPPDDLTRETGLTDEPQGTRIDDDAPYDVKRRSPWWHILLLAAAGALFLESLIRDFL